jgi:glycosyltransferase involved in cell wall biosynthesis
MHVGLSAQLLSLSADYRAAGINWYIYSLLRHLPLVGKSHRYTAFLGDARARQAFPQLRQKTTYLPTVNPAVRIFWEQAIQPVQVLREGIDLLHSLAFVLPIVLPCPGVVTVYDLSFMVLPERLHPLRRLYLRWGTRYSAQRARGVIAISESTKRDLIRLLGIAESKVHVVPCGVDEDFQPLKDQRALDAFRSKAQLPEQMILFVGTIDPRKNLTLLLRGFALLRKKSARPRLVIGGARGWHWHEVFSVVDELGLAEEVIFPGYIPREELPLWYNAADLLVYPSLYEGFGLPPLEAMACGTPVITSNTSSLPEVVGDAGILVDPHSAEELAEAMHRVLIDGELREEMAKKGLDRARSFSWRSVAQQTTEFYERAVEYSRT